MTTSFLHLLCSRLSHGQCLFGCEKGLRTRGPRTKWTNAAIWGLFMNTTPQAAVHLGQDYDQNLRFVKNHFLNNACVLRVLNIVKVGVWISRVPNPLSGICPLVSGFPSSKSVVWILPPRILPPGGWVVFLSPKSIARAVLSASTSSTSSSSSSSQSSISDPPNGRR